MKLYRDDIGNRTFIGNLYFFFKEVIRAVKKNPILFPLTVITFLGCPTFIYLGREVKSFLGWFGFPCMLIAIGGSVYLKNKEKEPEDPLRTIEECISHIPLEKTGSSERIESDPFTKYLFDSLHRDDEDNEENNLNGGD